MKHLVKITLAAAAAAFGAASAQSPQPTPMTIVVHEGGANWKADVAPQEQLGPHFAYVGDVFKRGDLLAFGTQTDALRGYYVLKTGDSAKVKKFVDEDPAIKGKIVKNAGALGWAVLINNFAAPAPGQAFYILRYKPGVAWVKGKSLLQQDVAAHFGYIAEQAGKKVIVAAGPRSDADEGFYVAAAGAEAEIDQMIANDPGVTSGLFAPEVISWSVIAMQAGK